MSIPYLLSYFNPFSYFPSKPILEEYEELSEPRWVVAGEEIRIIRHGEDLNYLVVDLISGKIIRQRYIDKYGRSADEVIDYFKRGVSPEVMEDGNIDFVTAFRSQLDSTNIITENEWAITMADVLACDPNPIEYGSWAGHAVLYIERVINKKYHLDRVHLGITTGSNKPKVVFTPIPNFDRTRLQNQTETWIKSAEKIKKMISAIEEDILRQDSGGIGILFNRRGSDALLWKTREINGEIYYKENCYTYLREKVKLAGIDLVSGKSSLIMTAPKTNIDPASLNSKARVYVAIADISAAENPSRLPFINRMLDITQVINYSVKGWKRSWQALSSLRNNTYIYDGKTFDVAAKTNARIKKERPFYRVSVEKTIIIVKIRNEGLEYIDVTFEIKQHICNALRDEFRHDRNMDSYHVV
ncbi:MAG: hypothetical protein KR126chlam4_00790 [Candidatus Anoxychlamydiales bacterium]|uniref:Uncharacterized protein n=1 Tax=marine sediment metagenome TaxID=412755 RepID=A0A0F9K9A8_9ZZZZ|nr:hypothetical protein [Candidatus Anoxychlamydiales bacterium]HEU63853.1 hypothetical protein [Chlamydiota bacterium]